MRSTALRLVGWVHERLGVATDRLSPAPEEDTRPSPYASAREGFSFRLRFTLPDRSRIQTEANSWRLATLAGDGEDVVLFARSWHSEMLRDARELVLLGSGYGSEDEALEAGRRWRGILQTSFAGLHTGADFGDRAPQAGISDHLRQQAAAVGHRLMNDVHRLMAFETLPPPPAFIGGSARGSAVQSEEVVMGAIQTAYTTPVSVARVHEMAYDLHGASFFQPSSDARFMLLVMVLETLIDPQPRDEETLRHVEALIEATNDAAIPGGQVKSILGSLEWLKEDSIGQAGERLAKRLGDGTYDGRGPAKFVNEAYAARSALAHGNLNRPSYADVGRMAASLEIMVGDLLHLLAQPEPDS